MTDNTVTLTGNLTRDPELRFTPNGAAVADFGIAINTRRKEGDQWVDGDPEFYDITCWRQLAENVADTLTKGTRVIVNGRLQYRTWENDQGEKRTKVDIVADSIGPDLRWATAQITRNERSDSTSSSGQARSMHATPAAPVGADEEPF